MPGHTGLPTPLPPLGSRGPRSALTAAGCRESRSAAALPAHPAPGRRSGRLRGDTERGEGDARTARGQAPAAGGEAAAPRGFTCQGGRQLADGQHLLHDVAPGAAVPQQVGGSEGQVELPGLGHGPQLHGAAAASRPRRPRRSETRARAALPRPRPLSRPIRAQLPPPRPLTRPISAQLRPLARHGSPVLPLPDSRCGRKGPGGPRRGHRSSSPGGGGAAAMAALVRAAGRALLGRAAALLPAERSVSSGGARCGPVRPGLPVPISSPLAGLTRRIRIKEPPKPKQVDRWTKKRALFGVYDNVGILGET